MKVIYLCGSDPNLSFEKGLAVYKKYLKNTFELNPIAIKEIGIKKVIRPRDWKKRSDTKLPRKPKKFLIS